jgi:hypothetical protein
VAEIAALGLDEGLVRGERRMKVAEYIAIYSASLRRSAARPGA